MIKLSNQRIRRLLREHGILTARHIMTWHYGPAHELAHALVAPRSRRHRCGFGLDCVDRCGRYHDCTARVSVDRAEHEERCAFLLTQWLIRRIRDRPHRWLLEHTINTDEDTLYVGRVEWQRARRELARKGLHPRMTIGEIKTRLRA